MAQLNSLIVTGASRFLGKIYCGDLNVSGTSAFAALSASSISSSGTLSATGATTLSSTLGVTGAATFSSTITATGNITSSGNIYSNGGYLYLTNKLAADGNKTANNWLTINGTNAFSEGTHVKNKLKSDNLLATKATIGNGEITGDLVVNGILESNEMRTNITQAVGGSMYLGPTFIGTENTTIVCTAASTTTISFTITDGTAITGLAYGGANWYNGSRIKFTGKILSNNTANTIQMVFSSADGVLTANMNSSSNKLSFTVNYANANTYFQSSATNLTFEDISVMMYQIKSGDNYYPVGIYMKSYGDGSKNAFIDIYGGTTTQPNARLGLLNGLKDPEDVTQDLTIGGQTVSGWGLMTTVGFFKGTIVAKSGIIGGWTIGNTTLTSGTLGSDGSVWLSTDSVTATQFAGASSALSTWRIASGSHFGVTSDGTLYCNQLEASGGHIAGWRIESTYLASGSATAPAANVLYLCPAGTTSSYNIAGTNTSGWVITSGTTFGVNKNGGIYATSGKIGGFTIGATSLTNGTWGTADSVMLCTGTTTAKSIGGSASISGWAISAGANFGVTKEGAIYADRGKIGGWTTSPDGLVGTSYLGSEVQIGNQTGEEHNIIGLCPDVPTVDQELIDNYSDYAIWVGSITTINNSITRNTPFYVTHNGHIYTKFGQIGPWYFTDSAIYKVSSTMGSSSTNAAYFGNAGLSITDKFKVTSAGVLTATGATITGSVSATSFDINGAAITTDTGNYSYNPNGKYISTSGGVFSIMTDSARAINGPSLQITAPWLNVSTFAKISYLEVANTFSATRLRSPEAYLPKIYAEDITFLNTTGIKFAGTRNENTLIRFIANTQDTYGHGIAIGGGGPTIIGGGESASAIVSDTTKFPSMNTGGEYMVVANDGSIQFLSNCGNGTSSAYEYVMTSTGNFTTQGSITANTTGEDVFIWARNDNSACYAALRSYSGSSSPGKGTHGLYSSAYWNAGTSAAVTSTQWMCYRIPSDSKIHLDSLGSGTVAHGYFNCYGNNFSRGTGGLHCGVYRDDASNNFVSVHFAEGGNHGLWSSGYGTPASGNTATSMTSSGKWLIYRNTSGDSFTNVEYASNIRRIMMVAASTSSGTGGYIDFNYNKTTASESDWTNRLISGNGILYVRTGTTANSGVSSVNGNLRFKTLNGSADMPAIASVTTAKEQVGYVRCSSATGFGVYGLWNTDATWKYMYASMTTSDPRLKDNIKPTEMNALDLVNKLPLYQFDWKADGKHWDVGFIAPEIESIDPALVHKPKENEEGDMWGVESFYLTGIHTKAIQELSAENEILKKRISKLETIISERLGVEI